MKRGRIFTVHYGSNLEITQSFVESIQNFLNPSLDLVIVNNSPEINVHQFQKQYIQVINAPENLGYFGGFRFGLENASTGNSDFIIICNNDIRIINPDFFSIIEQKLNSYDIIAPSIITRDGIEQNPHRQGHPTTIRKWFYKAYYFNYLFARILTQLVFIKKKLTKSVNSVPVEKKIFSPHGAFILFNSSYFKKGGYIDTGVFLYGEEDSVTAIALLNNLKIGFVPSLKINHLESVTTGKGISKSKYFYKKQAYDYIKKKYPVIYTTNNKPSSF